MDVCKGLYGCSKLIDSIRLEVHTKNGLKVRNKHNNDSMSEGLLFSMHIEKQISLKI